MRAKKFLLFMLPMSLLTNIGLFLIMLFIVTKFYISNDFSDKVYLLEKEPSIFFAGDSRAERQLNPLVASSFLNLDKTEIANIANSSADVIMVSDFIKNNQKNFKNSVVIISVSAFEINDGATKPGYISNTSLSKMTPFEILFINKFHPQNIISFLKICMKDFVKKNIHLDNQKSFENTLGFNPIDGIVKEKSVTIDNESKNPWYENWKPREIRYKLFEESLKEIKKNVKQVYIYSGPFTPEWREVMRESIPYRNEVEFQSLIAQLCRKNGIKYINYFDNKNFTNDDFYDSAHLNKEGADKFTKIIIKDFLLNH